MAAAPHPTLRALLEELRRRRVYRVGAIYAAGAFVVLQAADLVLPSLPLPEGSFTFVLLLVAMGFPVALALAWVFEITPDGLRTERGGRLSDFLGGTRRARVAVAGVVLCASTGSGFFGWAVWLRPTPGKAAEAADIAVSSGLDPARVAVLYFDDHSPGRELGWLADGLTEGLIHELSQIEQLEVVSRNGVKPFRDRAVPTDSIVARLGAGSVVEGSITGSPERVRLTVQLVDGASDTHVESFMFERDRDDLFELQEELARDVADALRRRLGRELALREARRGTESLEAWTLVQRAARMQSDYEALWREDAAAALRALARADSLLAQAGRLDPAWAQPPLRRAGVALSRALLTGDLPGRLGVEAARAGLEHAEVTLARDSASADAYRLRGVLRRGLARSIEGGEATRLRSLVEADLRRAVELDPWSAASWAALSGWLVQSGRFAEADVAAARALEADAFLELPHEVLHQYYYARLQEGPVDEAKRACDEGHARFPSSPDFVTCQLFVLASFPQVAPDVARAWVLVDSLGRVASSRNAAALRTFGTLQVAKVAARAGLPDSARAILRLARGDSTPDQFLYDEAHAWLLMGEPDVALALLDRYLDFDPDTAFLAGDWWFEALGNDPRFLAMVGQAR